MYFEEMSWRGNGMYWSEIPTLSAVKFPWMLSECIRSITSSIMHEEEDTSREGIPSNIERGCEPKLKSFVEVVEPDSGPKCSQLGHTSRNSMSSGSHFCGVKLSSQQESCAIGSKLSPERREEINLHQKAGSWPHHSKCLLRWWSVWLRRTILLLFH